ncbi:hypothetical protein RHS01_01742 [Rhizoctonia solani]|uniref:FAD/NAD(P)-binding domain-containing protein n=1 Tax=Rhizoctonia solani TaxID=456999 RepID=A0A8H7IL76_9AGAM|nr:hypothetical protein RHS01_01742 [Rhizoctonia solani]
MILTLWYIFCWVTIIASIFLLVLEAVWSTLRRLAVNSTTATHEIARLGKHHPLGRVHGNAVVAGGSMAGLATAVVCSKFFERVIVIEPDSMNEHKRTRVAQAEQIHAGSLPDTLFISRLSLEKLLREYVRSIPTIEIVQGSVTRITPDVTRQRIECVTVQAKGCSSETLEFDAAMFADYPKISYATALIPVPGRLKDILPIFTRHLDEYSTFSKLGYVKSIVPHPEQDDRIVCMVRSDEDHLMCGVGGWNLSLEARPRSFGDYIQQVDSIWQNASDGKSAEGDASRIAVMDTLRAIEVALRMGSSQNSNIARWVSPYHIIRGVRRSSVFTPNPGSCYKIDYTSAPKPSNFVTIGDSFLPHRRDARWGLPATFSNEMFARQIPRVMHMWDSTKGSDYGRRGTELVEGETPDIGEFGRNYWRRVIQVANKDKNAAADIIRSLQLIAPPLDLLRPSLFIRGMWYGTKAP